MTIDSTPLSFFRALHGAYLQTLQQPSDDRLLPVMNQAWDSFDGNVAIQSEGQPAIACHKGCAACCTLRVSATAPEVFVAARFLRATAKAWEEHGISLTQRLRDADRDTRGLGEAERVRLRRRCPFILQGACAIYKVRPLACRGHASHDKKACAEAAAGRSDEVPFSGPHRLVRSLVQTALQSALRDIQLPWGSYEFNQALTLTLDDERSETRWLAGDDGAIAAAAIEREQHEEMALAFDAAKSG
jgi:Fe-S-cluster containining protein